MDINILRAKFNGKVDHNRTVVEVVRFMLVNALAVAASIRGEVILPSVYGIAVTPPVMMAPLQRILFGPDRQMCSANNQVCYLNVSCGDTNTCSFLW